MSGVTILAGTVLYISSSLFLVLSAQCMDKDLGADQKKEKEEMSGDPAASRELPAGRLFQDNFRITTSFFFVIFCPTQDHRSMCGRTENNKKKDRKRSESIQFLPLRGGS